MKVLALNSSPRGADQSKTELMLDSLVDGMRSAGANVDIVHLRSKKINYCISCYTCWTKTPGVCLHKDDMSRELFTKFIEADIAVFATPLYYFGVNAQLKTFMERTLPAIKPFIIERDGKASHPFRDKHPLIVALSVAGFPEDSIFDLMSSHLQYIYKDALIAEIYRPAVETMVVPGFEKIRDDVLDATRSAGGEIIRTSKVSEETMRRIKQPVVDLHTLSETANAYWRECIEKRITPKEFWAGVKDYMGRK